MKALLVFAGAIAAVVSAPAEAAILTYNVSGTFTDGSLLSGHFSFDDAGTGTFSQYSNVALTVTGANSFTATSINNVRSQTGGGTNLPFAIGGGTPSGTVRIGFMANYTSSPALRAITSPTLITGTDFFSTLYFTGNTAVGLSSGTITNASSAVPEPATWAMMMLGLGTVGYVLRRRRSVVSIA